MNEKHSRPSEEDQLWLKELFDTADSIPPAEVPSGSDPAGEDEQWLQELFASAEQAAEVSFTAEEPEEEDTLAEDFQLSDDFREIFSEAAPAPAPEQPPQPAPQPAPQPIAPTSVTEGEPEEFDEPEDAPEAPDEKKEAKKECPDVQPPKRRPKNRGGYGLFGIPHILVTAVWLAIILTFGVFLGQWLWRGASDVLAFGREDKVVHITITEKDDLDSLINKLQTAGLIHEPMWFRLYAQISDVMEDIGVGTYELNTLFDYRALVTHMSPNSSARVTVKVRIPEGSTCADIFRLMEEKGVCSAKKLETASISGELNSFWFLEGVARDHKYCLEGYLFPDTYEFYVDDKPERVLNTLLANFEDRFTDIMMGKLEVLNDTLADMMRKNGLPESYIQDHAFTIREVIIIASLIEKETASAVERYTISSVFYNRLTNPDNYPYLNIDASLVYITGNRDLTDADKAIDSPYNTYLYPGLIPGPICNPSRASIDAALDPTSTNYYFYAFDPSTNEHHFSATYEEHQKFLDSLAKEEKTTP